MTLSTSQHIYSMKVLALLAILALLSTAPVAHAQDLPANALALFVKACDGGVIDAQCQAYIKLCGNLCKADNTSCIALIKGVKEAKPDLWKKVGPAFCKGQVGDGNIKGCLAHVEVTPP